MLNTCDELLTAIDEALAESVYTARLQPPEQQLAAGEAALAEHPLQAQLADLALTRSGLLESWAWSEDVPATLDAVRAALRRRLADLVAEHDAR